MSRIIRCTIEMELIEGRDFASAIPDVGELSDDEARAEAAMRFVEIVATNDDIEDYVQTKIVEEPS